MAHVVAGEPMQGTYATLHSFVSGLNLGKTEAVMEQFEEHGIDCLEDLEAAAQNHGSSLDQTPGGSKAIGAEPVSAAAFAAKLGVTRTHARKILRALDKRRQLRDAVETTGLPEPGSLLISLSGAQIHTLDAVANQTVNDVAKASGLTKTQCRKIRKACVALLEDEMTHGNTQNGTSAMSGGVDSAVPSPLLGTAAHAKVPITADDTPLLHLALDNSEGASPSGILLSPGEPAGTPTASVSAAGTPSILRRLSEVMPPNAGLALETAIASPSITGLPKSFANDSLPIASDANPTLLTGAAKTDAAGIRIGAIHQESGSDDDGGRDTPSEGKVHEVGGRVDDASSVRRETFTPQDPSPGPVSKPNPFLLQMRVGPQKKKRKKKKTPKRATKDAVVKVVALNAFAEGARPADPPVTTLELQRNVPEALGNDAAESAVLNNESLEQAPETENRSIDSGIGANRVEVANADALDSDRVASRAGENLLEVSGAAPTRIERIAPLLTTPAKEAEAVAKAESAFAKARRIRNRKARQVAAARKKRAQSGAGPHQAAASSSGTIDVTSRSFSLATDTGSVTRPGELDLPKQSVDSTVSGIPVHAGDSASGAPGLHTGQGSSTNTTPMSKHEQSDSPRGTFSSLPSLALGMEMPSEASSERESSPLSPQSKAMKRDLAISEARRMSQLRNNAVHSKRESESGSGVFTLGPEDQTAHPTRRIPEPTKAALAMLTSGSDTDTDLEGATVPKSPVDDYLNDALGQSPGHCNSSGHDPVHRGFKFSGPLDDSAPSEEEKDIASGDDSESARLSEPSSMSRRSPGRGPRPSVLARYDPAAAADDGSLVRRGHRSSFPEVGVVAAALKKFMANKKANKHLLVPKKRTSVKKRSGHASPRNYKGQSPVVAATEAAVAAEQGTSSSMPRDEDEQQQGQGQEGEAEEDQTQGAEGAHLADIAETPDSAAEGNFDQKDDVSATDSTDEANLSVALSPKASWPALHRSPSSHGLQVDSLEDEGIVDGADESAEPAHICKDTTAEILDAPRPSLSPAPMAEAALQRNDDIHSLDPKDLQILELQKQLREAHAVAAKAAEVAARAAAEAAEAAKAAQEAQSAALAAEEAADQERAKAKARAMTSQVVARSLGTTASAPTLAVRRKPSNVPLPKVLQPLELEDESEIGPPEMPDTANSLLSPTHQNVLESEASRQADPAPPERSHQPAFGHRSPSPSPKAVTVVRTRVQFGRAAGSPASQSSWLSREDDTIDLTDDDEDEDEVGIEHGTVVRPTRNAPPPRTDAQQQQHQQHIPLPAKFVPPSVRRSLISSEFSFAPPRPLNNGFDDVLVNDAALEAVKNALAASGDRARQQRTRVVGWKGRSNAGSFGPLNDLYLLPQSSTSAPVAEPGFPALHNLSTSKKLLPSPRSPVYTESVNLAESRFGAFKGSGTEKPSNERDAMGTSTGDTHRAQAPSLLTEQSKQPENAFFPEGPTTFLGLDALDAALDGLGGSPSPPPQRPVTFSDLSGVVASRATPETLNPPPPGLARVETEWSNGRTQWQQGLEQSLDRFLKTQERGMTEVLALMESPDRNRGNTGR